MSFKKIQKIVNEGYNYEDSSELSSLVKELEEIEDGLYYSMSTDSDSEEVRRTLKPFVSKLKSFIDGRE